jgi:hypothetical protein
MFLSKFDLFASTVVEPKAKKSKKKKQYHVIAVTPGVIVTENVRAKNKICATEKALPKIKMRFGKEVTFDKVMVRAGSRKNPK